MNLPEEQAFTAKKVDIRLWARLYGYALRSRRAVILVFVTMLIVALIDVLYPLFTSYAIDRFVVPAITEGAGRFTLVYILAVIIQGLGTLSFIVLCGKLEMNISYDIRQDAFTRLQELSFSFYDRTPVGYLMARTVSDVSRLSEMVAWSFVDVLFAVFYVVGSTISMFLLSWKLALIVLCVAPPLAAVSIYLQKKLLSYQREMRKQNSRITSAFNEGIMGAVTTKTLVREEAGAAEFNGLTRDMRRVSIKSALASAAFFPIIISLGAIGTGLALWAGGVGVIRPETALIGGISAGTLVAFISYSTQLFDPIQQLASVLAELLGSQASAERVLALIDTQPAIVDRPEVIARYGDSLHPKTENWEPIDGRVTFEHVSFHYAPEEPVLRDFSLEVPAGTTVALVGETGAGKSTIVNLVCRFYEPVTGRVLIDGRDSRDRSQLWLQSNLGYVLQTPHLFSGTIGDNIRFGTPGASDEQVRAAAQLVHAEEFILRQEKGYDTQVGEGGALLSTGQKQLISFARVILKNPRIFVLDEATSSVDTETEQLLQNAISRILAGRTSFIVAHRLSTVRTADRILVIQDGGIAEDGNHTSLMEKRGLYYHLYTQQFQEEETLDSLQTERTDDLCNTPT